SSEGCTVGRGMGGGASDRHAAISPDGRSLYAPNRPGDGLTVFDRDPGTGRLAQKAGAAGCFATTATGGCTVDPKFNKTFNATVSPDGKQVYVSVIDGIVTMARAPDGSLSFQSCITESGSAGCARGRNLYSVSFTTISPDGQTLLGVLENPNYGFVALER